MSHIRFNHVFAALLLLSGLSAFVIPRQVTDPVRAQVQNVFAPVAWPVRQLASSVKDRFEGEKIDEGSPTTQPRSNGQILLENEDLRLEVASLQAQLDALKELNADRQKLGDVRALCTPVPVMGSDAGLRESLSLQATSLDGLAANMPVLYSGGLAGRIDRVGVGGAQVRLITDKDFRVTGAFARFQRSEDGKLEFVRLATPSPLVVGMGKGQMVIRSPLTLKDVENAGVRENDWVILSDPDWPLAIQGYKLGRVISVAKQTSAPLYPEITVKPTGSLMGLREVMVMNK
jgi:cell shape-determining protein MreC